MSWRDLAAALFDAWGLAVDRSLPEEWRPAAEPSALLQALALPVLGILYGVLLRLCAGALAILTVPAGTALLTAAVAMAASESRTSARGLTLTARAFAGWFSSADPRQDGTERAAAGAGTAALLTVIVLAGLKLLLLYQLCRTGGVLWAGGAMTLALTLEARLAAYPDAGGDAILELSPAETRLLWILPALFLLLLALCRPLAAVAAFLLTLWWSQWFARNRQESQAGLTADAITLGSYVLESAVLLLAAVLIR